MNETGTKKLHEFPSSVCVCVCVGVCVCVCVGRCVCVCVCSDLAVGFGLTF